MFVAKNDTVKVIRGADRGKEGKVVKVLPRENRILVQGVHLVWKHLKRSADYPHGGRIQKEIPVHISNVMLVCPNCSKATRVGYQKPVLSAEQTGAPSGGLPTGVKNRICKKCKQPITGSS